MKTFLVLISFALAGCQANLPTQKKSLVATSSAPPPTTTAPVPSAHLALEQKVRQQTQYIEALISENDALRAKLAAAPTPQESIKAAEPARPVPTSTIEPIKSAPRDSEPSLIPNADGLIDLLAVKAGAGNEPTNPFAVRTALPDSTREVSLRVSGIVTGPVACAVINDRLFQVGEAVETFALERIDPDAVFLRHDRERLKLAVSGKPVRVRMPL